MGRSAEATAMIVAVALALASCGEPRAPTAAAPPPAIARHHGDEAALAAVSLTPDAIARLGIEVASAEMRSLMGRRRLAGEMIAPPGRALMITAPVAGTLIAADLPRPGARISAGEALARLIPLAAVDRDLRAQARSRIEAAEARLAAGESRVKRAETLVESRAGSERAAEDARLERDIAAADLAAARARLRMIDRAPLAADVATTLRAPFAALVRQVLVADGQAVAAGAPLFDLVATGASWVRVPVPDAELLALAEGPVSVSKLGLEGPTTRATPTQGPPSADPIAGTVDRYYILDAEGPFHLGERVQVDLPVDVAPTICVAASAIVVDVDGGTWLYVQVADGAYDRRRVEVDRVVDGIAAVTRGLAVGDAVVIVGAAELFGVEFGAGH